MKRKILALGIFSLTCLTVFASDSQAFFGLFHHHKYTTQITCRPYNAFTPICWGNLVCDGCCPSPCGVASGCLPMTMGVPPWAASNCGMAYMGQGAGYDFSRASDMPINQGPAMPMPPINTSPYRAPMPNPIPSGPGTTMMYPPNGVSQANYMPMYMPQVPNYYMPTYYNPYQPWQPMPYYWYGQGR